MNIVVEAVKEADSRKQVVESILNQLPEWFGIPESTAEYVRESASMPMWGAYLKEEAVGFLSLKQHNSYTAEIYVMGVRKEYHRCGIGESLFREVYRWCQKNGLEFLQVKTLSELSDDCFYAKTRRFYSKMGFRPLECMPKLWGESNPCLIMIMSITK